MKATVSLNVKIFKIFSKSQTKCSRSAREYFFDRGFPSRTRPLRSDYFGVNCSPSISSEPSESLRGSSIISASWSDFETLPSPRSSFALASISSFSSSVLLPLLAAVLLSSSYKCRLMNSSISSSLPPSGSSLWSSGSSYSSGSLSNFFSDGVLLPANMLLLSCKFYFELLFEYLLTTTLELELNLVC